MITNAGGKGAETVESVVRRNVLPELGGLPVHKLTSRQSLDWHRDIAEPQYHSYFSDTHVPALRNRQRASG